MTDVNSFFPIISVIIPAYFINYSINYSIHYSFNESDNLFLVIIPIFLQSFLHEVNMSGCS